MAHWVSVGEVWIIGALDIEMFWLFLEWMDIHPDALFFQVNDGGECGRLAYIYTCIYLDQSM